MSRLTVFSFCAALCGVVQAVVAAEAPAEPQREASGVEIAQAIESAVGRVFESALPSVVRVESEDELGRISGTGFFADADGTIYTLSSVVGDGTSVTVAQGESKRPAKLLAKDGRSGIALIKVENDSPRPFLVKAGENSQVRPSTPLVVVGFPFDLDATPSFGVVGGLDRKSRGKFFATTHIRANIPVQRGQGGSPVLDLRGNVVGILVSGFGSGSGCYVLPIAAAEKLRNDFRRFGEVRHGWAGVTLLELPEAVEGSHMAVDVVDPSGPAAQDFRAGDVILQVGNTVIRQPEDAVDAAFFLTAGDPVKVRVARGGKILEMPFTPGEHPLERKASLQALGPGSLLNSPGELAP